MRTALSFLIPALPGLALFSGCNPMEDIPGFGDDKKKIDFDIMVTRDGKVVTKTGSGSYSGYFDSFMWGESNKINFSAYYPHVGSVSYGAGNENYSIPYSVQETEAGPLVSKTVQKAIDQLNMVPLVFQHITNDIGFKICDVTPKEELQGLIHLRTTSSSTASSIRSISDST